MADVLKKFGRYFLLDHLAQGGMAEIYRARLASHDGAGRLIVIKRVLAGHGSDAQFLQMFKSEIKVTMGFNHPNIVQLYDFGEEDGQPFIAMEWVDGKNLKQYIARSSEHSDVFPIELAAHIIEQAASGLHYAHSFRDKITGESLNIVHRDISPQNILISFEGNVKIIDFGIAKATTNIESTRAGVIKGKPSYLSPEQINGDALDGRSDVFALGAVFWEVLTGKKLFAGENDLAVLKLIESAQTHVKPPSSINPKVPKELDYIVLKSLAKQREKRYQNAEELQRSLHKFLYSYAPDFNPSDLSYYAKDLFKNEIVDDRKRIQRLNEKVERLISLDDSEKFNRDEFIAPVQKKEDTTTVVDQRRRLTPNSSGAREIGRGDQQIEIENAPKVNFQRKSQPTEAASSSGNVKQNLKNNAAPARQVKEKKSLSSFFLVAAVLALGLYMYGPDYGIPMPNLSQLNQISGLSQILSFLKTTPKTSKDQNLAIERETPVEAAKAELGKSILLRLNILPIGNATVITLNGKPLPNRAPASLVNLDTPLELSVETPGYKPLRREFFVESKQVSGLKEWLMEVQLDPIRFGYFTVHTTPSAEAFVQVEGGQWRKKTPFENEKLPVGHYKVRLLNEILGMEKTVDLTVQEGKSLTIDERLEVKN